MLSAFVVICASATKLFTAFLSETSIYRIQFFGDLLQGIEAAEMFNILVFAILGWGLGFATVFVPRQFGVRVNTTIGLLVFPVLLSVSSVLRYHTWIDEFATTEKLTPIQAISQTDLYLNAKVNQTGFLGFYLHTAKYPGLPTTRVQMDEVDSLEEKAADRMETMIGITPERLSLSFAICMWGIRLFYLALSLLTGISNFTQGVNFADRLGQRS